MKVKELGLALGCPCVAGGNAQDRDVTGCYCGDLLSWVMGRAKSGDAWITVMGNINSIGVAVLADISCIILSESADLDDDAKQRADQQGVVIFKSGKTTYEIAKEISELLKNQRI